MGGGTHCAASGAVRECFISTGSGSSSLSCTAVSSVSDSSLGSSGRAKARGRPWCRRRATGGFAVGHQGHRHGGHTPAVGHPLPRF